MMNETPQDEYDRLHPQWQVALMQTTLGEKYVEAWRGEGDDQEVLDSPDAIADYLNTLEADLVAAREAQAEAEQAHAEVMDALSETITERDAALAKLAEAERSFRAVDETLEATVNRLADVMGERDTAIRHRHQVTRKYDAALAANALLDDLYDWAKRWQAGRRENTEAHAKGRANYAQVILNAGTMNKELDAILEALANTKQAGAEAHTEDEVKP